MKATRGIVLSVRTEEFWGFRFGFATVPAPVIRPPGNIKSV